MVIDASIKNGRFFRRYVEILNVLFNLSNREMDILALFMELDFTWHTDKFKDILDTSSRKYIMKKTYVNKSNLSRYISMFKEKNILKFIEEDGWEINRRIMPVILDNPDPKIKDKNLIITFNINIEDEG